MEFDDLKGFVAVAEHCAFRRAALNTGMRQSVLSRRVRKLEDELGVSLLERHRSGVSLTGAGRDYLKTNKNVLTLSGCLIAVAGTALVLKSRAELGPTWSFVPKADQGTGLATTGSNRLVRHPITLSTSA